MRALLLDQLTAGAAGRGARLLLLVVAPLAGCESLDPTIPQPREHLVIQNGSRQVVYAGPDRQVERVVLDADGDGRAEAQTFFVDARVVRTEADMDRDGRLDRWEEFDPPGTLARVATSRRRSGRPDAWDHYDRTHVTRREADENGDGRPDVRLVLARGIPLREELDSDYDGTWDRSVDLTRPAATGARGPDPR